MRLSSLLFAVALAVGIAASATAKNKRKRKPAAEVTGAKLMETIVPSKGFVDDPFGFDGAGSRLLYINADTAGLAQIVVFDLAQRARLSIVDISAFTTTPTTVEFALDGEHYFVTARENDESPAIAALLDSKGKAVRKFGPADHVGLVRYGGADAVALYWREETRRKGGPKTIVHAVEVRSLGSGKRLGKKTTLVTDMNGYNKKLDFTVRTWRDSYTVAIGIKGGKWDRREDQRSPDVEGWYDLPQRTFSRKAKIKNLIDHTKKMQLMAEHPNEDRFVQVTKDLSGVEGVIDGDATQIALAQPFHHYDHKSLVHYTGTDGTIYFTLQIDPVNPDAVARKRADKEWLDLYQLAPQAKKAVRKARMRVKGKTSLSWRATGSHWIVVPRHVGFDRGGKSLKIYALE